MLTDPVYWPALAWLAACLCTILGYTIGRAFQREEHISMQLENIHLRGSLDRESIRARTAEEDARRLRAQISLDTLRRVKNVRIDESRIRQPTSEELEWAKAEAEKLGLLECVEGAGQLVEGAGLIAGVGAGDPAQPPKPYSLPSNSER